MKLGLVLIIVACVAGGAQIVAQLYPSGLESAPPAKVVQWKRPQAREPVDPPPPESPQPRQEVINESAPQESARPPQDAAEQGKARPLVNEEAMFDAIDEAVKRTTGGGMYYTQFRAAGEVAAETGRSLLLVIADKHPKDFEPPVGVVFCVVPSPPDGFRGWPTPSAILFREVTFAGHSDPVELDPTNLQSSLNQALETVP